MDPASVKKLKVQELKDALAERGLDTSGLKPVLVERLETALRAAQPNGAAAAPNGTAAETAEEPAVDVTEPDATMAEAPAAEPATAEGEPADTGTERATSGGAAKVELSNQELLKAMPEAEKKKLRAARFGGGAAGVGPLSKVDLAEEIRKRKERAKKFGLPVPVFAAEEELKKQQRRERFNLPPTAEEKAKMEAAEKAAIAKDLADKKQARAERFGIAKEESKPAAASKAADEDKAAARAKRFASNTKAESAPAAKKAATEADPALAAKLKARAERFGVPTK